MDKLDKDLDVECAFLDKKSLERYPKGEFIKGIMSANKKYKKKALELLKKEDLIVIYCHEKGYKLVDGRESLHFPG